MAKVSVIVPFYNSEKYLKRCLDSLVRQTLKDIEIIITNGFIKVANLKMLWDNIFILHSIKFSKIIKLIKAMQDINKTIILSFLLRE